MSVVFTLNWFCICIDKPSLKYRNWHILSYNNVSSVTKYKNMKKLSLICCNDCGKSWLSNQKYVEELKKIQDERQNKKA